MLDLWVLAESATHAPGGWCVSVQDGPRSRVPEPSSLGFSSAFPFVHNVTCITSRCLSFPLFKWERCQVCYFESSEEQSPDEIGKERIYWGGCRRRPEGSQTLLQGDLEGRRPGPEVLSAAQHWGSLSQARR